MAERIASLLDHRYGSHFRKRVAGSRFAGRLRRMSFRHRVVLLSAAAVATAVVLASVIVFFVVRGELRGQIDDELRNLVSDIQLPSELPSGGVLALPPEPFGSSAGYAQIVQANGTVIRPQGARVTLPVTRSTLEVAAGQRHSFFSEEQINGIHARVYTTRLPVGVAVQAVRPLNEVDRSLRNLAITLALVSLCGIALAVWLGRLVARTALSPVSQLTEAAEHVARTRDLSRRMQAMGTDELSRLAASFNTMLEALDASQRAQRQLVADASHELRTPLTSLRTNIEVLAEAQSLPPEDRKRLLRDVVVQLEELTELITDLVDLARGAEPDLAIEDVRLDLLVSEAVERAGRHAPDKRFSTDLEPCLVRGMPARLDRAVGNLLDNAAKWSPPEQVIEVSVREGELTVRDHGPGIADTDLPFVFDRFYRASSARGMPGSGLGLSIVRQVAELHGGEVLAERAEDGGACLRLRVPTIEHEAEPAEAGAVLPSA
jgi:two-component system sensor histidine kinase MprB